MGWYPDPTGGVEERYWDGTRWTHNTREPMAQPDWQSGLGARVADPRQAGAPAPGPVPQVPTSTQWDHVSMQWREMPVVDQVKRTADGVPLAGWWWRVLGRLIDDLLIGLVVLAVCWPQFRAAYTAVRQWWDTAMADAMRGVPVDSVALANAIQDESTMIGLVSITLTCVSAAFFHARFAATPGQLVTGLRVVPAGQGNHRGGLPLPLAIKRAAGYAIILGLNRLIGLAYIIDALWPLFGDSRQTLHDKLGRTQVVRRAKGI